MNLRPKIVFLGIALLALKPAHALTTFRERENNNNRRHAQFLNTRDNKILVRGDRVHNHSADWFRVWSDRGTTLDLLVRTPLGSRFRHDPILGLFDSRGNELAFNDELFGPYGFDAGIFGYKTRTSGYYYVSVTGFGDRHFRGGNEGEGDDDHEGDDHEGEDHDDDHFGGGVGGNSGWTYDLSINRTNVPEPSEWALIGMAGLGVAGMMRRARLKIRNG